MDSIFAYSIFAYNNKVSELIIFLRINKYFLCKFVSKFQQKVLFLKLRMLHSLQTNVSAN